MRKGEYLKIILEGYINNKQFLSEHFYREFKNAEKNHVGIIEFGTGLKEVQEFFLNDLKRQYNDRLEELSIIKGLLKKEGKPIDDLEVPEIANFSVHLSSVTKNNYIGHLWLNDLDIINDALLKFISKYDADNLPLPPKQDIEDLTKEKLEGYGFDKESIDRLFTWENYECTLINNRGYFWASNKENKIYSGIAGKEKQFSNSIPPPYHKEPKEKFETFDELFKYAVLAGSITIPENVLGKDFNYKNAENSHNFSFNVWLQNYKGWEYGNEKMYIERLTRENWVAYLTHCNNEAEELKQKAETIKEQWQPKSSTPQPPEKSKAIDEKNPELVTENNTSIEAIEDWLYPFKEEKILTETDYNKLVLALRSYFETGVFPIMNKQINVGKVNIKRFGWALNEIFKANNTQNEKLSKHIEYLLFAKQNISIFRDVEFDEKNVLKSKLYNYFTTKTK